MVCFPRSLSGCIPSSLTIVKFFKRRIQDTTHPMRRSRALAKAARTVGHAHGKKETYEVIESQKSSWLGAVRNYYFYHGSDTPFRKTQYYSLTSFFVDRFLLSSTDDASPSRRRAHQELAPGAQPAIHPSSSPPTAAAAAPTCCRGHCAHQFVRY
jgi:hypothetical protein